MKKSITKSIFIYLVSVFCVLTIIAIAGSLTPSLSPAPTDYTLDDIYNLIVNNTTATVANHTLSTTTSPTATSSNSVSEIYALLANLIKQDKVKNGATYLGIAGNYGVSDTREDVTKLYSSLTPATSPAQTGYTLEDIYNLISNNSTTTAGNHSFSTSSSATETMHTIANIYDAIKPGSFIVASNIATGTTYLGVTGTYEPLSSIECGTVITENLLLDGNMSCGAGTALAIGADNITITGADFTITGNIDATKAGDRAYTGLSVLNATIVGNILSTGADGIDYETDSFAGGSVSLTNSTVGSITTSGGTALGTNSGSGGSVNVIDSTVTNITTAGGLAQSSGSTGNGGSVTVYNSEVTTIIANGGDFQGFISSVGGGGGSVTVGASVIGTITSRGSSAPGGAGGAGGTIIASSSNITSITVSGGLGGLAGAGGAVTITVNSFIETITTLGGDNDGGGPGGGNGGAVSVTDSLVSTVSTNGGIGNETGGNGGNGGNVTFNPCPSPNPSVTTTGGVPNGVDGTITPVDCHS